MSQTGCTATTTEPYALRVIGSSMSPEFEDGNIIIVDPGHPLYNEVYAVIEDQGEVLFGQYVEKNKQAWLHYLDTELEPVLLTNSFSVKGVITQRSNGRRKFLKHYNYPQN